MSELTIEIVSPAVAESNNGNWRTAVRWQGFLSATLPAVVTQHWSGERALAMVALHARRSADSIAKFGAAHPDRPLALILTGTDVYGNIDHVTVRHSLDCATHIVVLQEEAMRRLAPPDRAKARVIVQSATRFLCPDTLEPPREFVAVGHLRDEKDPLTLMRAARLLQGTGIPIVHIGEALDAALGEEARRTMEECRDYRWLGALPHGVARQRMACARALVHMSRIEGGANVVIEAVRSQVAVLASRIDGNVGLLGPTYEGYFAAADAAQLARLIRRVQEEPSFAEYLRSQCAARDALFAPEREADAVRDLIADMLL